MLLYNVYENKRVDTNSSHHKEKIPFMFVFEMMDVNLLFHDTCNSNHYAIQLKFLQCYGSIISQ